MIGLDFDGPLFDIGPIVAEEATNLLGRVISVSDITKHGLTECLNITEEQVRSIVDACWEERWFKENHFISGALDGMNLIRDLGHPIVIITARPHPERVRIFTRLYGY